MEYIKNMMGGGKNSSRTFTIHKIYDKKYQRCCGRYRNDTPQDAAKKAFRKILEKDDSKYVSFSFEIKETTKGSKKKIYKYTFTRILKDCPNIVKRDNKNIIYKYDIYNKYVKKPTKTKNCKPKKGYICSKEEKNDKLTGKLCCSKGNTLNKRTYEACKKHIQRINNKK